MCIEVTAFKASFEASVTKQLEMAVTSSWIMFASAKWRQRSLMEHMSNSFLLFKFCCTVYHVRYLTCLQPLDPNLSVFLSGRFSFFSRDKKRMQTTQKNVHFQDTFGEWADSNKDDSYTEQGQEALQHLWLTLQAALLTTVDLNILVTRSFRNQIWQLIVFYLPGTRWLFQTYFSKGIPQCLLGDCSLKTESRLCSNGYLYSGVSKLLDNWLCAE